MASSNFSSASCGIFSPLIIFVKKTILGDTCLIGLFGKIFGWFCFNYLNLVDRQLSKLLHFEFFRGNDLGNKV